MSHPASKRTPVLIVAHHFPPEHVVGALRPARFYRYLPEFGYEPWVLTASPQPEPRPRVHQAPYEPGLSGRILSLTAAPYDDRPLWNSVATAAGERLLRENPCRLILSTSPPYSAHLATAKLARRFGIPWVADLRDPLQGNACRKQSGPLHWIDGRVERTMLSATRVILNTEAAFDDWRRRYPAHAARFDFLYNGFDPADLPEPAQPLDPTARRTLLHAGSLYNIEYVRFLLAALRALAASGRLQPDRFALRFIGEAPAALTELEDFRFFATAGFIDGEIRLYPQKEARRMMREASYLLLLDFVRPGGSLQLPAKLFDYLPIGRPILAVTTPGSPMSRVLALSGLPHAAVLPSAGVPAAVEQLEQLMALPAGPHPLSAAYLSEFDGRAQTAKLASILDRVLAG